MKITAFHPSHFLAIRPRMEQVSACESVTAEQLAAMAAEPSLTVWIGGRPMAVAGVLGECELWSLIDQDIAPYRFSLFRASRRFLSTFGWLYANVPLQFDAGCRWLDHLGFKRTRGVEFLGSKYWRYERAV